MTELYGERSDWLSCQDGPLLRYRPFQLNSNKRKVQTQTASDDSLHGIMLVSMLDIGDRLLD